MGLHSLLLLALAAGTSLAGVSRTSVRRDTNTNRRDIDTDNPSASDPKTPVSSLTKPIINLDNPFAGNSITVPDSYELLEARFYAQVEDMKNLEHDGAILRYRKTDAGESIKNGIKLRILTAGDSITVGVGSGDGDGYRRQLKENLSRNEVVYAGTETGGTMDDNYFAAWNGKTIQYISNHAGPSLEQRPNIILLAAGTNDMSSNTETAAIEGNKPSEAVDRLGLAIDKMLEKCPDAVILVAIIVPSCDNTNVSPVDGDTRATRIPKFQNLIPDMIRRKYNAGKKVLAADFSTFGTSEMGDCIHPNPSGHRRMGDWWYSFIHQIPEDWLEAPVGADPDRSSSGDIDATENGGQHGVDAHGIGRSGDTVRLHDMNGDGKADYVWIHPTTGEIRLWLNNRPDGRWQQAGTDSDLIGKGVGPAKTIFLADLNGDRMDDYLVVDEDTGSVRIWWNYGPNKDWQHGWKWVPGDEIAGGMKHVNLATLRFPDLNGDGRADYTYIGEGGSVRSFLNVGAPGSTSLEWKDLGGVARGAVSDISRLVFADVNGDGRDDHLIWDSDAGLTGFLNRPSNREGVPFNVDQAKAKAIVGGIHRPHSEIRLADMDGDGKDDYVHVNSTGAISIWYNRGITEVHMQIDGIRFADIDGDGVDDYVWLHPTTGAPTVYLNRGANTGVALGWYWEPVNGGKPIAGGAAAAKNVMTDYLALCRDGKDDYIVLHPETGDFHVWLNKGKDDENRWGWSWDDDGLKSPPHGRAENMRVADLSGDGLADYIYLTDKGGMIIYAEVLVFGTRIWVRLTDAEADGIGQSPDEIQLVDINGDGKADYVWTRKFDGRTKVWYNNYPNSPRWLEGGEIAGGVGTAGSNIRWGTLTSTGRADYLAVEPLTGAVAAWLNYCETRPQRGEPVQFSRHLDGEVHENQKPASADLESDREFDSVVMTWTETNVTTQAVPGSYKTYNATG